MAGIWRGVPRPRGAQVYARLVWRPASDAARRVGSCHQEVYSDLRLPQVYVYHLDDILRGTGRRRKTPQNKPLEDCPLAEVGRRIRALASGLFNLVLRQHCRDQMRERDIDEADIRQVLRTGGVIGKHAPGGRWRYDMSGRTLEEGKEIKIAIAVDEERQRITVVTVMRKNRKGEWR